MLSHQVLVGVCRERAHSVFSPEMQENSASFIYGMLPLLQVYGM